MQYAKASLEPCEVCAILGHRGIEQPTRQPRTPLRGLGWIFLFFFFPIKTKKRKTILSWWRISLPMVISEVYIMDIIISLIYIIIIICINIQSNYFFLRPLGTTETTETAEKTLSTVVRDLSLVPLVPLPFGLLVSLVSFFFLFYR